MSDDNDATNEPSADPTNPLIALGILRKSATTQDVEVGVTLLVSGAWISGTLTSIRRYLDAMTSQIQTAQGQGAQAYAEAWAEGIEPAIASLLKNPFDDPLALYLRDVNIFLPTGDVVEGGPLAVRADSVAAFQMGKMATAGQTG